MIWTCICCGYDTVLDDVVCSHGEHCICLRCIQQAIVGGKPMPYRLRQWICAALAEVDG